MLLNAGYVAALDAITSSQVVIVTQQPQSPAVFRLAGAGDFVQVIMPMNMR